MPDAFIKFQITLPFSKLVTSFVLCAMPSMYTIAFGIVTSLTPLQSTLTMILPSCPDLNPIILIVLPLPPMRFKSAADIL